MFAKENKEFDGNFTTYCQHDFLPQSLKSFVEMTLQGTDISIKHKYLEQSVLTTSQLFMFNSIKRQRKSSSSIYTIHNKENNQSRFTLVWPYMQRREKKVLLMD